MLAAAQEEAMTSPRRDRNRSRPGARTYLAPLAWIAALMASYWVLADWQSLPELIANTIAAI